LGDRVGPLQASPALPFGHPAGSRGLDRDGPGAAPRVHAVASAPGGPVGDEGGGFRRLHRHPPVVLLYRPPCFWTVGRPSGRAAALLARGHPPGRATVVLDRPSSVRPGGRLPVQQEGVGSKSRPYRRTAAGPGERLPVQKDGCRGGQPQRNGARFRVTPGVRPSRAWHSTTLEDPGRSPAPVTARQWKVVCATAPRPHRPPRTPRHAVA
jgi:hypothetical protein